MVIDFSGLILGVEMMDAEHRKLAELFDAFEQCFHERSVEQKAEWVITEALTLANLHFEHEEEEMERSAFPFTAEHKFQHRNMRLQFTTLMADTLAHAKAHDPVTLEHLDIMRQLIKDHILGPDAALAAYLKKRQAA
ncbi:hemerythrin-like metal-binding protein [Rhizomicrobium palustre]|uniref:Hemerythrin-like metal-binding protein n=1 Tax=Rhizomicrobium palustre TaxID=189966 RepID=A0A846MZC0_9PROT|nr:hemerythrin domain-containing protein [Rhizomicrobium palustre]NIK88300.1 hemerythrin-like metal-binding protein [Rhizomicrobium palustre]